MVPIQIVGLSHALFFAIFFWSASRRGTKDKLAAVMISVFGFFLAAPLFHFLRLPFLMAFVPAFPFLFGPFLYFFTRSMTHERLLLRPGDALHFLPFLLFAGLSLFFLPHELPERYHRPGPGGGPVHLEPFRGGGGIVGAILGPATILSLFIYGGIILLHLRQHKNRIPQLFSSDSPFTDLRWLEYVALSFFGVIISVFALESFLPRGVVPIPRVHGVAVTTFILVFGFLNLRQKTLYGEDGDGDSLSDDPFPDDERAEILSSRSEVDTTGEDEERSAANDLQTDEEGGGEKYKKSRLPETTMDEYLATLESYMQIGHPYRNPDLSIFDLAKDTGISRHHITQVINEKLGKNFFTFINEYRVKEVQERMQDDLYRNHSLLRLSLDAGFNSKSSFNRIFKQIAGVTPSDFRKQSA